MSTILSFFNRIRLNLTQWLVVTVALVIAGLVEALRIQGSRLHKAQVALLEQSAAKGTQEAQKAYDDAKAAYLRAGGTLILALCLALPTHSPAGGDPNLLPACELALQACDQLVTAQKDQIKVLEQAADTNPPPSFLQSIPWPMWFILGTLAGVGVGAVGSKVK